MAQSLLTTLKQLQTAITEMSERNAALRARNEELETLNAELVRKADEAEKERQKVQLDADFLMVSHRLADNPDSLIQTRRHIAKLIRNIDRCLEMLKE